MYISDIGFQVRFLWLRRESEVKRVDLRTIKPLVFHKRCRLFKAEFPFANQWEIEEITSDILIVLVGHPLLFRVGARL